MPLDLHKLYRDVFHPEPNERVLVVTDCPRAGQSDSPEWADRRNMACEWHSAFDSLSRCVGFSLLPLLTYPATGAHNASLPMSEGRPIPLEEALSQATLAVALTEYSATAPMVQWAQAHRDFRAATLPGVARRTEQTALAADYSEIAARCGLVADALRDAEGARVCFTTGHTWFVDLRFREVKMDDGQLPRGKSGVPVINLPSGETFKVPYEGERPGEESRTAGSVPVCRGSETLVLRVEANRIVEVLGDGSEAAGFCDHLGTDPARSNIAEFALGINPRAQVWGNVLEDEKAGFHWAYGRSEHLGGTVGPAAFSSPDQVIHQDVVYANGSPISADQIVLEYADGGTRELVSSGRIVTFS